MFQKDTQSSGDLRYETLRDWNIAWIQGYLFHFLMKRV